MTVNRIFFFPSTEKNTHHPQNIYNIHAYQTLFHRSAHATVVNDNSIDTLDSMMVRIFIFMFVFSYLSLFLFLFFFFLFSIFPISFSFLDSVWQTNGKISYQ